MSLEQFVGAGIIIYLACWGLGTAYFRRDKPQPRPKVRRVWPSPQLPSAFEFGYDPYNTVHAHLIAMRHRFDSVVYEAHSLPRGVELQPLTPEQAAAIKVRLPPVQPWNASRYNKT